MLDLALPKTRTAIAHARRRAMAGGEQEALDYLNELLPTVPTHPIDLAAILITKAEILFLAGKYEASHHVFANELNTILPRLPHPVALVIGFNRSEVAMARLDSVGMSRHYDLIDEQHIARIEHWDSSSMVDAVNSAARGRSYESLPTIWRELLRAYRQGRWAVFRQASRYMADECLRIGLPQEAAFHAVIANEGECAKKIGAVLVDSRDVATVDATITKVLLTANLQLHFKVACELLVVLADVIPDYLVDRVLDWLLLRGATPERNEGFDSVDGIAWKTIESLAARASADTAQRIVTVACSHGAWTAAAEGPNHFIPVREEIIDALNQAVVVLPIGTLAELADATIPIATERRNFKDFNHVVNLLSHIAHRTTDDIKAKIASALYPPGQPIPAALMQAASGFGKEIVNKDGQFERYATQTANSIAQIVQRVPRGENSKPVDGTIMVFSSEKANETLMVHLISTENVWALARQKSQVPAESRRAVVAALLDAISNRDNLLENRISLIDCLRGFADSLDLSLAADVLNVLAPIASGNIEISTDLTSSVGESHPLSRTRFNGVTREQVTARALYVLAYIENRSRPGYGERLESIVRDALGDRSPEIRRCAFAAVREIPGIAEDTWMPLLLGTRDPDSEAAALAFDAISTKHNARFTRSQWKMVAYSLNIAQMSISIKLRKAAAMAVACLEPQAPNKALRMELSAIRKLFADDIAHSVRAAANRAEQTV